MNREALDRAIQTLQQNKDRWARMPIVDKVEHLKKLLAGTAKVADRQVQAAIKAKGIPADSPLVGEEYLGGPVTQARTIRLMIQALEDVMRHGAPRLKDNAIRTRGDGQVVVDVFPTTSLEKVMYAGFKAEVWMQRGVTPATVKDTQAGFYKEKNPVGHVALVLGAGNVASIGPLDMVQKLFAEGQVCLIKMNPVNDYLGPFIEEVFGDLIQLGFVRTAYGGGDVGEYLCQHPGIDEIHITGSDKTHDAIVYGVGPEGAQRKAEDKPRIDKRITSELGNVSPVIVVPGPWSKSDMEFHAENLATQMGNNGGFNCNACKVIILHEGWPQKQAFMDTLRSVLARAPQRRAYYPGAEERYERFVGAHPQAEPVGPRKPGVLPWTLIPNVDAKNGQDICFTQESWCGVTAQTTLPGADAAEYLRNAVRFCNETLWGTLNAGIIVHPKTEESLGGALEQAIADLRYGSVCVNHWAAMSYALGQTTWGAFPGHTMQDIQSGIGVVHNSNMFDRSEKSVVHGPFRMKPRPPWFITNKQTHNSARQLVKLETDPSFKHLPGLLFYAVRG
jgi:hypothetical protein